MSVSCPRPGISRFSLDLTAQTGWRGPASPARPANARGTELRETVFPRHSLKPSDPGFCMGLWEDGAWSD